MFLTNILVGFADENKNFKDIKNNRRWDRLKMSKIVQPMLILICLLVLGISAYSIFQSEKISSVIEDDYHLAKNIYIANTISSYAKRAESYLFLYLHLNDQIESEKYFDRMDALRETIYALNNILDESEKSTHIMELLSNTDEMLQIGKKLINDHDEKVNQTSQYPVKLQDEDIILFHELSNKIRKEGVKIVRESTDKLNKKNEGIIKKIFLDRIIIFSVAMLSVVFLIMISYQTNQLAASKILSAKLESLSRMDDLTGIANRRTFDESFYIEWHRAIREKNPISLMLIDVDYFKLFNDNYGHVDGDLCLKRIARALKIAIKRPADLVARYGGEEFVIILPNTDNAVDIAEECREIIEQSKIPHEYSDVSNVITISIGVGACIPDTKADPYNFIKTVDKALYRAKEEGRNRVESAPVSNV